MSTDDTHLLKWRRSLRRKAINILALIENKGQPCEEIDQEIIKLRHANNMWKEQGVWKKETVAIKLPEPKDLHFQATDE